MAPPSSPTSLHIKYVVFPPSGKPPSATTTLFLVLVGGRGMEIEGNFMKFTGIGVYLEDKAILSLAVKWKGKTTVELTDSIVFFRDIITVKYHGKRPFKRVFRIQEPVFVAFSALNIAMNFHGWISFFILLHYKLPMKPDKKPYYDYVGLWYLYGLLALNLWFGSVVFHSR
ncbi:unnamed protein product [Lactuca saligna]|uniref:Chalcone-flavonone isomerase family protein n=1 Tax=Lactuca saligna TaxID=75948 RepID=A0AA35VA09_LACSI|nr:unnamed protein product [Lactuca saligna]